MTILSTMGFLRSIKNTPNHTITERFANKGYTFERTRKSKSSKTGIYRHLSWAEKGAEFIIDFFKAKGMVPVNSLRHEKSRTITK